MQVVKADGATVVVTVDTTNRVVYVPTTLVAGGTNSGSLDSDSGLILSSGKKIMCLPGDNDHNWGMKLYATDTTVAKGFIDVGIATTNAQLLTTLSGSTVLTVNFLSPNFLIQTTSASAIGQIIQGAASRSAALLKLQTSAAGSLGNVSGGCFADIIATTSTTHTDGTFDTLSTITFVANSLIVNGDKHYFDYTLSVVGHALTTTDVKVAFGGITIFDSGALQLGTGTSTIRLKGYISRVTSTTCEASVEWNASGGGGIVLASADIQTFTGTGTLTGMTLSGTNALVLSAASASTNAASGDVSVVHGTAGILGFGS